MNYKKYIKIKFYYFNILFNIIYFNYYLNNIKFKRINNSNSLITKMAKNSLLKVFIIIISINNK